MNPSDQVWRHAANFILNYCKCQSSFPEFLCIGFGTSPPWRGFSWNSQMFQRRQTTDLVLAWAESADAPVPPHTDTHHSLLALHRSLINNYVCDVSRSVTWSKLRAKVLSSQMWSKTTVKPFPKETSNKTNCKLEFISDLKKKKPELYYIILHV